MTTKNHILHVAAQVAKTTGYSRITRDQIAKAAGLSGPTVLYHFGDMAGLRRAVMAFAVSEGVLEIVAQGLVVGDPVAIAAPEALRAAAVLRLTPQSAHT